MRSPHRLREAGDALRASRAETTAAPAPAVGVQSVAGVLALQRSVGNQATCGALGTARQRSIQRRLRYGPEFLGGTGLAGRAKAVVGQSTYTKIVDAFKRYRESSRASDRVGLLKTMLGLIVKWMNANAKSATHGNRGRIWKLRKLAEAIHEEIPNAEKEAKYMADVMDQDAKTTAGEHSKGPLPHMSYTAGVAADQARKLAAGETSPSAGETPEALALMKEYDLTDADVAAIKIYTVDDYKYINPAVAGDDAWMAKQLPKLGGPETGTTAADINAAKREGTRHAEMVLGALAKLPRKRRRTYRGLRLTAAEFKAEYQDKTTFKSSAFMSTSVDEPVAERFAQQRDTRDGKVGIVCTCNVTNGRDVADFSPLGQLEKEILLLPGATFSIDRVQKRDASAGDVYDVTMTQVA